MKEGVEKMEEGRSADGMCCVEVAMVGKITLRVVVGPKYIKSSTKNVGVLVCISIMSMQFWKGDDFSRALFTFDTA